MSYLEECFQNLRWWWLALNYWVRENVAERSHTGTADRYLEKQNTVHMDAIFVEKANLISHLLLTFIFLSLLSDVSSVNSPHQESSLREGHAYTATPL